MKPTRDAMRTIKRALHQCKQTTSCPVTPLFAPHVPWRPGDSGPLLLAPDLRASVPAGHALLLGIGEPLACCVCVGRGALAGVVDRARGRWILAPGVDFTVVWSPPLPPPDCGQLWDALALYHRQLVQAAYLLALGREYVVSWEFSRATLRLGSAAEHEMLLPLVVLGMAQRLPRYRRQFWVQLEWVLHAARTQEHPPTAGGAWVVSAPEWFTLVTAATPLLQAWTAPASPLLPGTWNPARTEFTVTDATAWTTAVLGHRYARHLDEDMLARHGPLPRAVWETLDRVVGPLHGVLCGDTDSRGWLEPASVNHIERLRQRVAWVTGGDVATLLKAEADQLRPRHQRRAGNSVAAFPEGPSTLALQGDIEDLGTHWPPCIAGGLAHARATTRLVNDDRRRMAAWLVHAKPELPAEALVEYVFGVAASDPRTRDFQQQVVYEQGRRRRVEEAGQPMRVPSCRMLREAAAPEGAAVLCPFSSCQACAQHGDMAATAPSFVTPLGYARAHQKRF